MDYIMLSILPGRSLLPLVQGTLLSSPFLSFPLLSSPFLSFYVLFTFCSLSAFLLQCSSYSFISSFISSSFLFVYVLCVIVAYCLKGGARVFVQAISPRILTELSFSIIEV